jgi:hypothetical protein
MILCPSQAVRSANAATDNVPTQEDFRFGQPHETTQLSKQNCQLSWFVFGRDVSDQVSKAFEFGHLGNARKSFVCHPTLRGQHPLPL